MATIEDYQNLWEQDAAIDASQLDIEASRVPLLHAKWWKHYSTERLRYKKFLFEQQRIYKYKWEWYLGKMDDQERTQLGWLPQPLKILSANVSIYLDADKDIQAIRIKVGYQEEVLKFIEDVLRQINSRGYHIKNTIDFLRFKNGA